MYHGDEDIHRAIVAGAMGYLLKDTLPDDLIRVIRDVHAGHAVDPARNRRRARAAGQSGDADLPRARRSSSCWRRGRETRRSRRRSGSAATRPARTSRASFRSSTCTTARPRWERPCGAGSSTSADRRPPIQNPEFTPLIRGCRAVPRTWMIGPSKPDNSTMAKGNPVTMALGIAILAMCALTLLPAQQERTATPAARGVHLPGSHRDSATGSQVRVGARWRRQLRLCLRRSLHARRRLRRDEPGARADGRIRAAMCWRRSPALRRAVRTTSVTSR